MSEPLKVLIIGGYGAFGGRLVDLVRDEPGLLLVVAGRSLTKARTFCATRNGAATLIPQAFDRDGAVADQIAEIAPDLVVDATGPFQTYGEDPYRVAEASLAYGADYMDLADGTDFVCGIARFDQQAKVSGRFLLSGVSSFPVLSSAAVRHLAHGLASVTSVSAGIAPSPHAGLGAGVVRAIASYAGKPVRLLRNGEPAVGYGLVDTRRFTVAPPGCMPLPSIRFSLVDVPDLRLIPQTWPGIQSVWAGAGPTPEILHRGMNALAWLVRLRLLPSLLPLAGLFHRVSHTIRWGEHRSGMFVEIVGRRPDGGSITRSWHILAEGDDGPMIPSMALAAVIRRMLSGIRPEAGARAATHELELSDYAPEFAQRRIFTGTRDDLGLPPDAPLYRRVLGEAWERLPPQIRALHDSGASIHASGRASVERGRNPLAWLVAAVFRFPKPGDGVPVSVVIEDRGGREVWTRNFAGRRFRSVQLQGRRRCDRLLDERFGPISFGLALVVEDQRLLLVPRRWTFLGLPMPRFLLPRGESYEAVEGGRFRFHVEIRLPLIGLIVRYRGALTIAPETSRNA